MLSLVHATKRLGLPLAHSPQILLTGLLLRCVTPQAILHGNRFATLVASAAMLCSELEWGQLD